MQDPIKQFVRKNKNRISDTALKGAVVFVGLSALATMGLVTYHNVKNGSYDGISQSLAAFAQGMVAGYLVAGAAYTAFEIKLDKYTE
jgi:hypothetical protein